MATKRLTQDEVIMNPIMEIMNDLRDVPQFKRGQVWCHSCGATMKVDAMGCLRTGWPKCCDQTMSIDSPEERKKCQWRLEAYGADINLTAEQRGPCYTAWTEWRDACEAEGECADIADFRAGFQFGWEAKQSGDDVEPASRSADSAPDLLEQAQEFCRSKEVSPVDANFYVEFADKVSRERVAAERRETDKLLDAVIRRFEKVRATLAILSGDKV